MLRLDWSQIVRPLAGMVLLGILALFAHNGISGSHGLGALRQAEALEQDLQGELAVLRADREALSNRVARLGDDYLDLDLLDERTRAVLGRARPDEIVLP